MKKDPSIFLEHILESITRIESFCKKMSFEKFEEDEKKRRMR